MYSRLLIANQAGRSLLIRRRLFTFTCGAPSHAQSHPPFHATPPCVPFNAQIQTCSVSFVCRDPFDASHSTTVTLEGLSQFDAAMRLALISARARGEADGAVPSAGAAAAAVPPLSAGAVPAAGAAPAEPAPVPVPAAREPPASGPNEAPAAAPSVGASLDGSGAEVNVAAVGGGRHRFWRSAWASCLGGNL